MSSGWELGVRAPASAPWSPDLQLGLLPLLPSRWWGQGGILHPRTWLPLPSKDVIGGSRGSGCTRCLWGCCPTLPRREEPRLGMLSTACTDRSSRLGEQRYIYLKHSLFSLCPQCHVSTGRCCQHPPWHIWELCVREAVGISVKQRCLCPSARSCSTAVACAGHLGSEARPGCEGFQPSINISVKKDRKRLFIRKQAKKQDCSRGDMCSGHAARATSCGGSEGSEPPLQRCPRPHTS